MSTGAAPRAACVAGRFYPSSARALEAALGALVGQSSEPRPEPRLMAMVPHAGYVYSGAIAGVTYRELSVPEHVLLLGPNHTGQGARRSLWSGGAWQTPLGEVPIAEELCEILRQHAGLTPDRGAHEKEHALEVELPFLQYREPAVSIAPVCLARMTLGECVSLGEHLASAISAFARPVLIVCSTDMSHYISKTEAERLDRLALDRVVAVEPERLYETVTAERISMCGFVPTTVGLVAARALGARGGRVVRYGSSGETTGDFTSVVAYAGAVLS